jgi:Family of unknown function (DUF6399)
MAVKQRAAHKAVAKAEEARKRGHEHLAKANDEPATRGPGRPPKVAASLEEVKQEIEAACQEHPRLSGQRETVTQSMRAIGHASHCVDLERGVRRNGKLIASAIQEHIDTMRTIAHQEGLRETCLERLEKAERVVPKMQATIELVSSDVRQQVRQLDLAQPQAYAMHAHRIPSYYLEHVASTRTVTQGEPLRELAGRLRTPLFEAGGALSELNPLEQHQLKAQALKLAEVLQRSSSNVEGRNGYLSLRHHQLRGLGHPRKRACLTAVHNFFLTRPDGTTAAERFFGQKPRSRFAAILESVELPPAPLRPPRRAVG